MRVAAFTFPAALIGLAAAQSLPVAWFWLFVTGISAIIFTALSNGALQLLVEDRYRGRLMALWVGVHRVVTDGGLAGLGCTRARDDCAAGGGVASSILLLVTGAMRGAEFWRRV